MALQKNIKEVESTEAGFIANAAAKNDGFLTDVIGYPMIKKRGNDYDYWFPEKSRDELGTYTYYDKTVKDLTALNDCIVQRRLSSYGDADTYLDFSTDDQVVLNVGGVPFLTVVESDSAAIGTLGGNLQVDGDAQIDGDLEVDGNLYINNLPAESDPATTVLVPGPDGCVSTRTVDQIRSDIGAAAVNHTHVGVYEPAITGTANRVLKIQSDGSGVGESIITDDGSSVTVAGNIIGSGASRLLLGVNTLDGADNRYVAISASNALGGGRSGQIVIYGNEYSGSGGDVSILAGNGITDRTGAVKVSPRMYIGTRPKNDNYWHIALGNKITLNQSNGTLYIGNNVYYNSPNWTRRVAGPACRMLLTNSGKFVVEAAMDGAEESTIAFNKLIYGTETGNVLFGKDTVTDPTNKIEVEGNAFINGTLTVNTIPAKSTTAASVFLTHENNTIKTRTAAQVLDDIGAAAVNDPRLSDARVPINNDYYVQGSNSTRTTDAGTTDVDSYSQSGFYRVNSTAPNLPTAAGYGIIHINHTSDPSAFQLASRWASNGLYYRRRNIGTWEPWVELYHSGNFDPADYVTLSTDQTITGQKTFSADTTINGTLTLGGNLALGTNTISLDGSADKGFGVSETGIPTVTATAVTLGDARTVLRLYDDTPYAEGNGAGIVLYGKTKDDGTYANLGGIKISKENGISGDISSSLYLISRKQGSDPANALRLDSSQNGYIRNKLMVGSLTGTPANQLVVYNAEETDTFIQVSNGFTGLGEGTGLIIGVETDGHSVLKVDYGSYLKFQSDDSGPIDMATLQYNGTTLFNVNGKIQGRQLAVYNTGATDTFIEVANGVTGLGAGLTVGVEAAYGDAVLRVDYGRFLRFQCESMYGPIDMATLRYTGTTEFIVDGWIQCDAFRLDQTPKAGSITPDKYITINCNGTEYKIPVVQA